MSNHDELEKIGLERARDATRRRNARRVTQSRRHVYRDEEPEGRKGRPTSLSDEDALQDLDFNEYEDYDDDDFCDMVVSELSLDREELVRQAKARRKLEKILEERELAGELDDF